MRLPGERIAVAALLTALTLSGCVRFESFPRPEVLTHKPRYLVEDHLRTLTEPVPGEQGASALVPVGSQLWVLLDPDPAAPVISLVESKLDVASGPSTGFYNAGLYRATYTLTVKVEGGGQSRQMQVTGSARSGLSLAVAAFAAVEEAVTTLSQSLART
jgi:hypothetical protein